MKKNDKKKYAKGFGVIGTLMIAVALMMTYSAAPAQSYVDGPSGKSPNVPWTYSHNNGNPYMTFDYTGVVKGGNSADNPDINDITVKFYMSGSGSPEVPEFTTRDTCPYLWTFYTNGSAACHFDHAMSRLAFMPAPDFTGVNVVVDGLPRTIHSVGARSDENLVFRVDGGVYDYQSIRVSGIIYLNKQDTADQIPPLTCNDGKCTGTETCSNCPADCGACPEPPPEESNIMAYAIGIIGIAMLASGGLIYSTVR